MNATPDSRSSYADVVADLATTRVPWGDARHPVNVLIHAGEAALPAVLAGCGHRDPSVRKLCFGVLDHLADDRAGEALRRGLEDPSAAVRRWAAHAISCDACKAAPLPFDAVAALGRLLRDDPSRAVRRVAATYLCLRAADPRAAGCLAEAVARDPDPVIQRRARAALAAVPAR